MEFSSRARAVDIDVGEEPGRAASILLRLQLKSRWNRRWSSLVEVDHVSTFYQNDHSDGQRLNGKPLVPDVPATVLNQLAVRYKGDQTELTLGRQRIEWDDQRFIGSDSFWQQDQTFDALLGERLVLVSSRFYFAYIARAQRIFVENEARREEPSEQDYYPNEYTIADETYPGYRADSSYSLAGEHRHNSHLLRLELNEWDYSQLVVYGYAIDNRDQPETSNYTLGGRYRFSYQAQPLRYRVILELAGQEHREVEEARPLYHLTELALGYQAWELLTRYEVLGSDEGAGFATPLGSSYLFQGFAGVFATTPAAGIEDASIRLNWRSHPWELSTRFHHFEPHRGPGDYGRELDLELQYKFSSKHKLQLRFADFRAHSSAEFLLDQRQVYLDYLYNF